MRFDQNFIHKNILIRKNDSLGAMMATLEEFLKLDSKSQLPLAKKSKTVVPLVHLGMLTPSQQNKKPHVIVRLLVLL